MRCKVCKAKITDEEEGIARIGYSDLCISCYVVYRKYHRIMRTPHDAIAK